MPKQAVASPQISVYLFKTIARKSLDGQSAVSTRYAGKDEYIDLTPFMQPGSTVRTTKSVREPAGGFSIVFADKPQKSGGFGGYVPALSSQNLESVSGLVEPMDMVEIRMWSGLGPRPAVLPIIMRGFITGVRRSQAMSNDGTPQRQVVVSGLDYGKIWQIIQVLYLAAYAEGKSLLTTQSLFELFGEKAKNAMKSGDFVKMMNDKVLTPFLQELLPENTPMPREFLADESVAVAHGMVNLGQQTMQGSIFEIMRLHCDVPSWNELYVEDREDGVHIVYRPIPALHITAPEGSSDRKIQDDAPDPIYITVFDSWVQSLDAGRSDANVANFFWVNNSRFDLIDDMPRRLAAISSDSSKVSLKDYANSAVKFYGLRPMMAETQQAGDDVENMSSGQDKATQESRGVKQEAWIDKRRRMLMEMNKDNVVFENGTLRIKGGPVRPDGESMKAGDYVRLVMGELEADAYVVQIEHEFQMYQSYTTTLMFERGEGFVNRISVPQSPWLLEQAARGGF